MKSIKSAFNKYYTSFLTLFLIATLSAAQTTNLQPIGGGLGAQPRDESAAPLNLDDGYGDAFVNYLPYIRRQPAKVLKPTPAPAPSQVPPEKRSEQKKVDVKWLTENYPLLEQRAVDNPTRENVAAFLYVRRVVMDKAQRYSEMVTKVTNEDPLLNENNRVPYASAGAQSVRNANYRAQLQAAKEMAALGGIFVFVDSECRFCAQQMPIIKSVKEETGIEALVISLDGKAPQGYGGKFLLDNGLWKKLGLKLTPSIVYVPNPKAFQEDTDPNKYLIVAQGFYAQDELIKQLAFAGHNSDLLSKETLRDLDVWNRGVASSEDMGKLRLDVNKPEDIKKIVEPLLLKQYKQ